MKLRLEVHFPEGARRRFHTVEWCKACRDGASVTEWIESIPERGKTTRKVRVVSEAEVVRAAKARR